MLVYLTVFASALGATWLLTPLARRLALRCGIVDKPDVRKQHRDPVPYCGGVAVFGGLLVGLIALLVLARNPSRSFDNLDVRTLALVGGGAVMFGLGLLDDVKNLRARHKLLVQFGLAAAMWFCGIRIEGIQVSETLRFDFGVFGFLITVVWIAGVTNAINFIDGLDGLAAGIGAISAAAIGYVAFESGQYPVAAMLAILCGSLLGFLPHNRHPAKIFLGDAGSLLIGFLLATSAVATSSKSAAFVSVAGPFLALALPILDLCFAVMRRWIERRGLFSADRNHVHHRLLALGYGHARTVWILWAESAALTGLAMVLLYAGTSNWQRLLAFGVVLAGHVWFFRATGAVRLKESYRAFKLAAARMQATKWHQKCFDELDLRFRSAKTLGDWWDSLSHAAQQFGVTTVRVRLSHGDDGGNELVWKNPNPAPGAMLRANLPLRVPSEFGIALLEVEVPSGSVEHAGSVLEVLGRLVDKHGLESMKSVFSPVRGKLPSLQSAVG